MRRESYWATGARWISQNRLIIVRSSFAALVVVVIVASIAPSSAVPQVASDKFEHLFAYGVLQIAGGFAFPKTTSLCRVAVGLILMGAALEAIQSFIPSRSAEWLDIAANAAGVILGWIAIASIPEPWRRLGAPSR